MERNFEKSFSLAHRECFHLHISEPFPLKFSQVNWLQSLICIMHPKKTINRTAVKAPVLLSWVLQRKRSRSLFNFAIQANMFFAYSYCVLWWLSWRCWIYNFCWNSKPSYSRWNGVNQWQIRVIHEYGMDKSLTSVYTKVYSLYTCDFIISRSNNILSLHLKYM